jgi:ketosteroid isomerase-like protein
MDTLEVGKTPMNKHHFLALAVAMVGLWTPATTVAQTRDQNGESIQMNSLETTKALFAAAQTKNLEALMNGFTETAVFAQPFHPMGPDFAYRGTSEIRQGMQGIFALIETIGYTDTTYTVSGDGRSVFVETKGDMVLAGSGKPYNNGYIFRVDFNGEGLVEKFTEYTNSLYIVQTIDLRQGQ